MDFGDEWGIVFGKQRWQGWAKCDSQIGNRCWRPYEREGEIIINDCTGFYSAFLILMTYC